MCLWIDDVMMSWRFMNEIHTLRSLLEFDNNDVKQLVFVAELTHLELNFFSRTATAVCVFVTYSFCTLYKYVLTKRVWC